MTKKFSFTSKLADSAASKVLRNPQASKAAKSAAGLALSQREAPSKAHSTLVREAASKVLRSSTTSKRSKIASGLSLTQRLVK